jgi:hypothetical protein
MKPRAVEICTAQYRVARPKWRLWWLWTGMLATGVSTAEAVGRSSATSGDAREGWCSRKSQRMSKEGDT